MNYSQYFKCKEEKDVVEVKKLNFIDQFNILFLSKNEIDMQKIESGNIGVFLKWLAFNPENLYICELLEKYHKFIDKDIIVWLMYYKVDISNRYIPYHKKAVMKEEFVRGYLCQYFGWSQRECRQYDLIIGDLYKDKKFLEKLSMMFAFNKTECNMLGLEFNVVAKEKKKSMGASLFSFVKAKS